MRAQMTGDGWATDVARPMFFKEGVEYHPGVATFFVTYMLLVFLVLVNIVLAVLLDEVSSSGRERTPRAQACEMGLVREWGQSTAVLS